MAVYKHGYKPYQGRITPLWSRFLVLPRYIYQDIFSSKLITAFFVACFFMPLGLALTLYLRHNLRALQLLEIPLESIQNFIAVDGRFFLVYLMIPQGVMAFLLTAFVGPGLVSMDLANNALPLYLCRPFSRTDYVLGKMSVIVILLSLITWIPGLLLVFFQASLEGFSWAWNHWSIPFAILLGSWIWILVLGLLTLAISAWVRWRPVAGAMLFAVFFVAAGFGEIINQTLDVRWGELFDLVELIGSVWSWLFGVEGWAEVSVGTAWITLLAISGFCLLVLNRRLKAYEVVR